MSGRDAIRRDILSAATYSTGSLLEPWTVERDTDPQGHARWNIMVTTGENVRSCVAFVFTEEDARLILHLRNMGLSFIAATDDALSRRRGIEEEREACAKIADDHDKYHRTAIAPDGTIVTADDLGARIASAIRARTAGKD